MMNLLIAAMSSGKSLVNGPTDCIIEDLVQMDKVNRQKEQDWKDEVNTMGDNKKKPVRPEDICIRIVSPDLTRAAYIQRLDDVQKAGAAHARMADKQGQRNHQHHGDHDDENACVGNKNFKTTFVPKAQGTGQQRRHGHVAGTLAQGHPVLQKDGHTNGRNQRHQSRVFFIQFI